MSSEAFCDLCDLPLSTCVHGMAAPPPSPHARVTPPPKATPVTRKRVASTEPKAPRAPRASTSRPAAPPAPPRALRRTPTVDFKPYLLLLLQEAGGEHEADLLYDALPERMAEILRPGDHETGPTGELRWRTAARKARKELADEGFVQAPQPGVLELTERGRALPPVFEA
ncbi:hypothetical protein [Nocardioides sp. GY 10127]|uniref:hypothetical protein n=1 Tax=Nocardioides sp. GY 10127 TaxID=2569762 RepID=UPI0010A84C98|nr:hypothetical protein [Nocardioides sp. GY 10127]TIC84410.1 hypothetical protein E8D37_06495 [Nocardioides sp. GY 10127]